ncbi:hypothetical protein JHD48_05930 [Sulfurimonas sp. SAG-AH-194-I05]|nr:hypothetical protein [Sulfurimonas sp. SAG-AH-194-I05]MDF1875265.1 hypothetical protein [Sulfurimonas sp. SAG-AH-194-I05]
MNLELILQIFIGLIFVLAILLFLLFFFRKPEPLVAPVVIKKEEPISPQSLEFLIKQIKHDTLDKKKLEATLDLILRRYGTIEDSFVKYEEVIIAMCTHAHVNKEILMDFEKKLLKRNPKFKEAIAQAITKGLNSRGV